MSGEALRPELVREARIVEMQEFAKHRVYVKVPVQECWDLTGKPPIGTRWVDINRGDEVRPEYRSRLVAQEVKKDKREDLFAATPPLEAKKILLSVFSSSETDPLGNPLALDFIDVSKAYYHAEAIRNLFVKLPPGDEEPGMCGRLRKAMPGTRDAAQCWERTYTQKLQQWGFEQGKSNPCVFFHPLNHSGIGFRGDDFTALASEKGTRLASWKQGPSSHSEV